MAPKTPKTEIEIGQTICGIIAAFVAFGGIVLMIWYWKRRFLFPLMGRGKFFSFSAGIGFIGICINFLMEGTSYTHPCAISVFWYAFSTISCCQIYFARCVRLLYRYRLQDLVQQVRTLREQGQINSKEIEKLLGSFYIKTRNFSTHKYLIRMVCSVVTLWQILLLVYGIFKTQIFSQPHQCNFFFIDKSSSLYFYNSLFIMVHIPLLITTSCLMWSCVPDGFNIKKELRAYAICIAIIVPLYQIDGLVPREVQWGKVLTLLGINSFFGSAFLYPIVLSYNNDQTIAKDKAKKIEDSSTVRKLEAKFFESDSTSDRRSTTTISTNAITPDITPHRIPWRRFVGLLRTRAGFNAMSLHLKNFFCSELVLFFKEADQYKPKPTAEKMFDIHLNFIGNNAPFEINLSAICLNDIEDKLADFESNSDGDKEGAVVLGTLQRKLKSKKKKGVPDIFDAAIEEVITLIRTNMSCKFRFPREAWKKSKLAEERKTVHSKRGSLQSISREQRTASTHSTHQRHRNTFNKSPGPELGYTSPPVEKSPQCKGARSMKFRAR